jgi:hypothetical protein
VSFHVSPYEVHATGSAITRLGDQIVSAVGLYAVGVDTAAAGSSMVAAAIDEVLSAWSSGLSRIGQHAEAVGRLARTAAGRYEAADGTIAESLPAPGALHRR